MPSSEVGPPILFWLRCRLTFSLLHPAIQSKFYGGIWTPLEVIGLAQRALVGPLGVFLGQSMCPLLGALVG